jgi:hypothetical protein
MMMLDSVVICVVKDDVFCSEHGSYFKKYLKTGMWFWGGGCIDVEP